MGTCQRMGLAPGNPAYANCVMRMIETYTQAQTSDTSSRRAAAASMYRPAPQVQVQPAAQPSIFGNVTPVTVPPLYVR